MTTTPTGSGIERIYLAMGCFWGAEEIYWLTPGVTATSVGYMGGLYPSPSYEEVCTGRTGHAETARVDYD
ncbi:MAG: peptide-methionine (S)-S-oxide reductase, partial [Candidatus Nanopelagicales bacterium]|nr:peptide-methionine (S)-S-oxide reductase [Candidatus Nanopelagicales bacterium]